MNCTPRLFVIVGTPGSGKDILIRAVKVLGSRHADIVPKHTSRPQREDDGKEMICPGDDNYDFERCDVTYENYGDQYGIRSDKIWEGFRDHRFQVAVVSDLGAIKELQRIFGELLVLVYVHSDKSVEEYRKEEMKRGGVDYVKRRVQEYEQARQLYLDKFLAFNHVLIYAGLEEDLYDQIFRLFRAYERGYLYHAKARPIASERIWDYRDGSNLSSENEKIILGGEPTDSDDDL
jgi:ribose 1,5-bisphosphokinase PhnN